MSGKDIHVDWHMTPDEWEELRGILLRNNGFEYIGRLEAEGLLTATPKRQRAAGNEDATSEIGKALQLAVLFAWLAYMAYLIAGLVT